MADERIRAGLREFVRERTGLELDDDADLFGRGLISSMFAMELVVRIEEEFGVEVIGADLALDNFRSVAAMAGLVGRLRGGRDGE
ncbi:methoxymalonate biosynthesis protein [Amycolatopsis thailandensis]|uniref:Methoxymalonate biosynthesis protein n=1 Tax=Amycolatopsis thailandensis TaxID=589330 RepID=A0A229SIF7_9PSEU|nr:phosphopantetheine-binding protein [Amycolatopsis thailandensis]OXM58511.1 methoxymalonate biosynthesis protein [Amycolatopsis thailandensis]